MKDKQFWGHPAYKIVFAVKPILLKKLDLKNLRTSISEMLTNQDTRENCKAMEKKLANENGPMHAAEIIESNFARQIPKGKV